MKLTPLDIHHKEFRHSLRGYNEEEVDVFLDEVADEFERLFKENIDLNERLEAMGEKVRSFEQIEQSLQNTLVSAQKSAEDIMSKARNEADFVLRDAEVKAKEIIHAALAEKQRVQADLVRMKKAQDEFTAQVRQILDKQMSAMADINLPEDVTIPTNEVEALDSLHSKVEDYRSEMAAPAAAPAAPPVSQPLAQEPADEGSVQSIQLGEVSAPDLGPQEPAFEEPPEFTPPSFGKVGEREDDVDIEEID